MMEPREIIDKYYPAESLSRTLLIEHSRQVAERSVEIAKSLADRHTVDEVFVEEAAWLHDIGIYLTNAHGFGCHGKADYIEHGVLGAKILTREGYPAHARVCERHIGVGLSCEDIRSQGLPLPERNMLPESMEEKIIAYADLFFSKKHPGQRTPDDVRKGLARFGPQKLATFETWHALFRP